MKNAMKFLTLCVLAGVVVAMCGCTSAPHTTLSPSVNATANITKNTTKATVKATVKPTAVKPTTPVATPNNRRPDGTVATPVPTAYPTSSPMSAAEPSRPAGVPYTPTATPTPNPVKETTHTVWAPETQAVMTSGVGGPQISKAANPGGYTFYFEIQPATASGHVTFELDGNTIGSMDIPGGSYATGSFHITPFQMSPGWHGVGVFYEGNEYYASSGLIAPTVFEVVA